MTLPLAIAGFLVWPGTPDKPNRFVLKEKDIALAKARLWRKGHATPQVFSWRTIKRSLTNWRFYIVTWWGIVFWNATDAPSAGAWLLWLKSLKRYNATELNNMGAIAPALGIFYVLFICFSSDLYLGRPLAITLAQTLNAICRSSGRSGMCLKGRNGSPTLSRLLAWQIRPSCTVGSKIS